MRSVERAGGRQVVDLSSFNAMAIEVPAQALKCIAQQTQMCD